MNRRWQHSLLSIAATLLASIIPSVPALHAAEETPKAAASGGTEGNGTQSDEAAGTDGAATDPEEQVLKNIWWNQPKMIEALKLSDEQRKKMDASFTKSRDKLTASRKTQREDRTVFEQALKDGKWDAARKAAKEMNEGVARLSTAQAEMKIDVLSLLNEEQRKTLVSDHPQLLRAPWVRGVQAGQRRGGQMGRQRRPRPQGPED